ncbi:MAG TPA: MBL fold metallo-hydrolase [Candidatus Eisenbergiella merdipullorum]|uniref:MBL fold metallo-hydrolase n=1 Tax=Candidatus Eisenbergiella merdipullorum TaxID=2838553 RepID=A0A9D2I7B0_9FIRM|nr:MBL fold metallo-hydrolase [Candidatus Eisenbergiella merdipullorum]
MKICWIGQSGYVLTSGSTKIVIDPYLSDSVYRASGKKRLVEPPVLPEELHADAVVCTHNHLDHLDPDTISRMDHKQRIYTTKEGVEKLREMGYDQAIALKAGDTVEEGAFRLTAVPAFHTVEAFGLIIQAEGITLYFSGDTLYDERLKEIGSFHPDVSFLCINGKLGNMNVSEAVEVALAIGARRSVPNHYGMFASNTEDPEKFTAHVPDSFIMELGQAYDVEDLL